MAADVDHLEGETSLREVPGQSRISATMFQDAMHTKDSGPRVPLWLPASAPQVTTIRKSKAGIVLNHVANPSVVHQRLLLARGNFSTRLISKQDAKDIGWPAVGKR